MSNIDKMRFEEILSEITLTLNSDDLTFITRDCPEMLDELEKAQNVVRVGGKELKVVGEAVRDIFIKYEEKIDKAKVVLLTAYNSEKMLEEENLDLKYRKKLKENVEKCIRILGSKNLTVATTVSMDSEDRVGLVVINSIEFARMIKRGEKLNTTGINITKKKRERLEKFDEINSLQNIARLLLLEDFAYIFPETEISNMIIYQISHNGFSDFIKAHPDKRDEFENEENRDLDEIERLIETSEECLNAKVETIMQNCKYIDIDKMLLVVAFRLFELIEMELTERSIKKEDGTIVKSILDTDTLRLYFEFLCNIYNEIQEGTKIGYAGDSEVSYSLPELERDLRRFLDGKYITKKQTKELKEKLLKGEITLEECDDREIGLIKFSKEEFIQVISQSEENMIYFIKQENITGNDIIFLLNKRESCSKKLFEAIEEKELLSSGQILALFEKGIFNAEIISSIQNPELLNEINNRVKAMLIELNGIVFEDSEKQDTEDLEFFIKYVGLYKSLNIAGKTEEEILENAFKLISSLESGLDNETLERFYQYGLIPLESAADWGVNLTAMLYNNSIKPNDLKELYKKGIIKLDEIKRVISQQYLPYDEKMDLIYSTFDGDTQEDEDIRYELIELLESVDAYKEKTKGHKKVKPADPKVKNLEYVTDPFKRWQVISAIDKDGSKKILPQNMDVRDGHRVFYFPKFGEVLIEKMYEKRHGETESAYASATYIMESATFFKNINEIIKSGSINRTFLAELYRSGDAYRQVHGAEWAKHILKHFGIIKDVQNEKYTQGEIKKLYELAEGVKKSRRLRD